MSKELYLPEDKDILDSLESIGTPSSGLRAEQQKQELERLQIMATLRSRKAFFDADKSSFRFSWIVFVFTMAQLGIAVFQFIFGIFTPEATWNKVVVTGAFLAFVIGLVLIGLRKLTSEND